MDAGPEATPQEQLNAALRDFNAVNSALPPGMNPVGLDLAAIERTGAFDALVRLLIEDGTLDEQEFIAAKCGRMTDLIRASAEHARAAKREAMGLVIASAAPQSPRASGARSCG